MSKKCRLITLQDINSCAELLISETNVCIAAETRRQTVMSWLLTASIVVCTVLELTEGNEQTAAWKKELEERQRDEAFNNALLNRIRQSRGKK